DRQRFLRAESDRVVGLLRIVDAVDVEGAHTDAVVRNTEPDAALGKLVLGEEVLEREPERVRVAKLAADDDAGTERLTSDLQQLGRAVVRHARGCKLRRADLQADDLLAFATAVDLDLRRLLLLRLGCRCAVGVFLLADRDVALPERDRLSLLLRR